MTKEEIQKKSFEIYSDNITVGNGSINASARVGYVRGRMEAEEEIEELKDKIASIADNIGKGYHTGDVWTDQDQLIMRVFGELKALNSR